MNDYIKIFSLYGFLLNPGRALQRPGQKQCFGYAGLIKELKQEGETILLSSHNQVDIDELCESVCEMDAGVMTVIRE